MRTKSVKARRVLLLLGLLLALWAAFLLHRFPVGPGASEAAAVTMRTESGQSGAETLELVAGRVMSDAMPPLLRSVPLSPEAQWRIFDLCGQDGDLFCTVMAIANQETRFDASAVGDDGRSIGMMQIHFAYHTERMESLGVTDLTDPVQCAAVGISYIRELADQFQVGTDSQILYLAYNMGPTGARKALARGQYSSSYTRAVAGICEAYRQEFSAGG